MEPIHSKPLIRLKGPLGIQYLTKAGIKIGKLLVGSFGIFKVPGASKIILRAGTANRWVFLIPIHVKFDLTFSPPIIVIYLPGQIGSYILAFSYNIVRKNAGLLVGYRIRPAKLSVKISRPVIYLRQIIVYLIKQGLLIPAHIFYRNPGAFPEGHGKIAVISPRWIYIDRQRRHKGRRIPAAAKEIS